MIYVGWEYGGYEQTCMQYGTPFAILRARPHAEKYTERTRGYRNT